MSTTRAPRFRGDSVSTVRAHRSVSTVSGPRLRGDPVNALRAFKGALWMAPFFVAVFLVVALIFVAFARAATTLPPSAVIVTILPAPTVQAQPPAPSIACTTDGGAPVATITIVGYQGPYTLSISGDTRNFLVSDGAGHTGLSVDNGNAIIVVPTGINMADCGKTKYLTMTAVTP